MPLYEIEDEKGNIFELESETFPTEDELVEIFAEYQSKPTEKSKSLPASDKVTEENKPAPETQKESFLESTHSAAIRVTKNIISGGLTSIKTTADAARWVGFEEGGKVVSQGIEEIIKHNYEVENPNYLDDAIRAIGQVPFFLLPGFAVAKGINALKLVPAALELGEAVGLSLTTVLEMASVAGGVYDKVLKKTGNKDEAQNSGAEAFILSGPLHYVCNNYLFTTAKNGIKGLIAKAFQSEFTEEMGDTVIETATTGDFELTKEGDLDLLKTIQKIGYSGLVAAPVSLFGAGINNLMISNLPITDEQTMQWATQKMADMEQLGNDYLYSKEKMEIEEAQNNILNQPPEETKPVTEAEVEGIESPYKNVFQENINAKINEIQTDPNMPQEVKDLFVAPEIAETPIIQEEQRPEIMETEIKTELPTEETLPEFETKPIDETQTNIEPELTPDEKSETGYKTVNIEEQTADIPKDVPVVMKGKNLILQETENISDESTVKQGDTIIKEAEKIPLTLPEEDFALQAQIKLQDKLKRGEQLTEAAEKVYEKPLPDDINFRLQAELETGKTFEQTKEVDDWFIDKNDSFVKRLNNSKFTIEDLGDYLYAKVALKKNPYQLEKLGKENGSGITTEEANAILEKYKDSGIENFIEEFRENVTRKKLKILLDSELINQEDYDNMMNVYGDDYAPTKGIFEGIETAKTKTKGFSVKSKGVLNSLGRDSWAVNPAIQAVIDLQVAIKQANRNKVAKSFYQFTKEFPSPDLYSSRTLTYRPLFDDKGDLVRYEERLNDKLEDNEFYVRIDGKGKAIMIKDKTLLRAMKDLGTEKSLTYMQKIHSYLRSMITLWRPSFLITNFEGDIQTALVNISKEGVKDIQKNMIKDLPTASKALWTDIRGGEKNSYSEYVKRYKEAGASTGWSRLENFEQKEQALADKINKEQNSGKFKKGVDSTLTLIEDLNEIAENTLRVTAFKNLTDTGMTDAKAAGIAKNLTINFNKKGEWGPIINSLWLFSNASIQGTTIMLKSLKYKPVQKICAGLVAAGFLNNFLNRSLNDDEFKKLSPWEKYNNWLIVSPSGMHYRIKSPYGYSIFNALGSITADYIMGDITAGEAIKHSFNSVLDAFNPLGNGIMPTIVAPIFEIYTNKDWAGRPIRKTQYPGALKPESQMYFKGVNPYTQKFTEWLNKVTGGNEKKSGYIDINPENIDHLVKFVFPGLGQDISAIISTGKNVLIEGQFPAVENIPIINRIAGSPNDWADRNNALSMLSESSRVLYNPSQVEKFNNSLNAALKSETINYKEYKKMRKEFNTKQRNLKRLEK
jgi:hypothetical protein